MVEGVCCPRELLVTEAMRHNDSLAGQVGDRGVDGELTNAEVVLPRVPQGAHLTGGGGQANLQSLLKNKGASSGVGIPRRSALNNGLSLNLSRGNSGSNPNSIKVVLNQGSRPNLSVHHLPRGADHGSRSGRGGDNRGEGVDPTTSGIGGSCSTPIRRGSWFGGWTGHGSSLSWSRRCLLSSASGDRVIPAAPHWAPTRLLVGSNHHLREEGRGSEDTRAIALQSAWGLRGRGRGPP